MIHDRVHNEAPIIEADRPLIFMRNIFPTTGDTKMAVRDLINPFFPTVPTCAVRETASLGIMGAPRVPPLTLILTGGGHMAPPYGFCIVPTKRRFKKARDHLTFSI